MRVKKILLLEDDLLIAKSLKLSLSYHNFEVHSASSIASARSLFETSKFDFVILDVNLPDGTSFDFCDSIHHKNPEVPIIMLTARTDEESAILGMKSGADDYVRKPFGVNELILRMQKLLARSQTPNKPIEFGPIRMDNASRRAWVKDRSLELSKREFDILYELIRKKGEVLSRNDILNIFGQNNDIYDRTIDSHLSHLRKKLRDVQAQDISITPVYGVGYRLEQKTEGAND